MPCLLSHFMRTLSIGSRHVHISSARLAYDKQLLSKLRKQTGFTISNCKKALELHDNDYKKAEEWIIKEAQSQGWAKATKLQNRATPQGLVGVHIEKDLGILAEINCETDFVARNEVFQSFVEDVLKYCTMDAEKLVGSASVVKEHLNLEQLENIPANDGKKLSDLRALAIGKIQENIILQRATRIRVPEGIYLHSYVHPSTHDAPKKHGKYACLIALKNIAQDDDIPRELCSHIVGTNPTSIGSLDEINEAEESQSSASSSNEESSTSSSNESNTSSLNDEKPKDSTDTSSSSSDSESDSDIEEDSSFKAECVLVRQRFLSDPDVTVGKILLEQNIEVVDFTRYECGEIVKA